MARGKFGPDITGMRSGMVTALEKSEHQRRGCALWRCRCDCGKEFYTEGYKISGGIIQSCGCQRHVHKFKDLTEQRFGKLTALKRLTEKRGKDSSYLWLCRCDCGNELKVSTNALLQGRNTSCGCGKRERGRAAAKDIAGEKFGRLTAIAATDKRANSSVVWQCVCECGNTVEVTHNSLKSGNTKSCGCLRQESPGPPAYMRYIDDTCIEALESQKLRVDNTSGYTGVQATRNGNWHAFIGFRKKTFHLGTYSRIEDAVAARKAAEEHYFGEFLNWYYSVFPGNEDTQMEPAE